MRVLRVFLASIVASMSAPAFAVEFDWCAPVATRPLSRWSNEAECVPRWTQQEIATGADLVLLGGAELPDVAPLDAASRRCGPPASRAAHAKWIAGVEQAVPAGRRPPLFVWMARFDLVGPQLAARDGFLPGFLAPTARSWLEVLDFFRRDTSPDCAEGCRLQTDGADYTSLAERIDALSEPGRAGRVVLYLDRSSTGKRRFHPTRALAQLRDPAYRKWRVAEAKHALAVGSYDAVQLNHKFFQYSRTADRARGHWIGAPGSETVTAINERGDTLWTASPVDYDYGKYVSGWHALGRDLRDAGVPYVVNLGIGAWTGAADDPGTRADEAALIREVARGAAAVLLQKSGWRIRRSGAAADLAEAGVPVTVYDPACGRPGARVGGAPTDPKR